MTGRFLLPASTPPSAGNRHCWLQRFFVVAGGVGDIAFAQSLAARRHAVKLIEVPLTPTDKMFTGRPVAYTPGSAKKLTPAPEPKTDEPTEPSAPPIEPSEERE